MISGLKGRYPHHVPSYLEVSCPDCSGAAKFESAEFRLLPKRLHGASLNRRKNVRLVRFAPPTRGLDPHVDRTYAAIFSGLGKKPPFEIRDENRTGLNSSNPYGTVICSACHRHQKIQLTWPDRLHYQLSYKGRRLWFYNRAHALSYLQLLGDPDANTAWHGWYHIELPTIFKDKAARKNLPSKMRRLLKS